MLDMESGFKTGNEPQDRGDGKKKSGRLDGDTEEEGHSFMKLQLG